MKFSYKTPIMLIAAVLVAACGNEAKQQLTTLAHSDSIRVDSLANVRQDLMDEMMTSTQFINDINTELAKARTMAAKPAPKLDNVSESAKVNEDRKVVVARISRLVASLDSVQHRLASTRARAAQLSEKDAGLLARISVYQKNISDLQESAERQRNDFQMVIDRQTTQIAALNSKVDTLNTVRVALADTVDQLTTLENTAYYVVGTRDELIKDGILVENGPRRYLFAGPHPLAPARELDPSHFTKIDRRTDRTISLPAGEYKILSRQNPAYAQPLQEKDGKIMGSLTIKQPEQFWQASPFLIIVRI